MTIYLSQYLQKYIINIYILTESNQHEEKDTFTGREYWYYMFNGEKRGKMDPLPSTTRMVDIALRYFNQFIQNNIQTLKWSLKEPNHSHQLTFNYTNQLVQFLPQLQTINLRCDDNANIPVLMSLKSIRQHILPHLEINIEFHLNAKRTYGDIMWPINSFSRGLGVNTVALGILFYSIDFIPMVRDLHPQSLNLYNGSLEEGFPHLPYSKLFSHLTGSIKHLNIGYDFVELSELRFLVDDNQFMHLESLKVNLMTYTLYELKSTFLPELPFELPFEPNVQYESSMTDWIEFCSNLYQNTTLKRLYLCDRPGNQSSRTKLQTFQLAFESIRSGPSGGGNCKIDYLALKCMPNVMSVNFWNTLCHVNGITKLLLTNGTVTDDMIPYLANLVSTNTTITVLSIRGNELDFNNELEQAFKQNKTITVLDIGRNFCQDDDNHFDEPSSFFNALLYSDTILVLGS
ncbi:hypothetical protein DFA_05044 [Cavenderia fasciculata]|uniref:Uncharacterized protein n=1 Tax=Cavenderia fasciculata TaxID=261658 RepID=F4PN21_CACFS|nr:uncharacterized protein DFA_05044 [Cavenderia fasciculata]EGG22914.1 hypothetical protein DFA_05044 [Cavenderia fasciculata]|eukprot:XP_004360765.1 hypothetical protein DFA_05044 [Cavenderia fasciculata]